MVRDVWTLGGPGGHIDLELVERPGAVDEAKRAESRQLLERVGYDFRFGDRDTRRVVMEICARLGGGAPPSIRQRMQSSSDFGSADGSSYVDALMRAVQTGTLIVRRRAPRRVIKTINAAPEALGPEPEVAAEADVFVLAAEVKLIGDTPLIRHSVRVLDPDTGEVVADGLTTDENGIVRTDVPANKTYRIEIVDHDPGVHAWRTLSTPHPMLRCVFVDAAGTPIPDLDVTVKDLEGHSVELSADENGLLEMPMALGLHEVVVDDESHWVHSLLHTDGADDAYEIVVSSKLEDGGDGIDPDDRLTRSWEYEDDEDDDGALA